MMTWRAAVRVSPAAERPAESNKACTTRQEAKALERAKQSYTARSRFGQPHLALRFPDPSTHLNRRLVAESCNLMWGVGTGPRVKGTTLRRKSEA
eukprot:scaffold64182_cov33-Tisochrysis_lutea.AAC.2